MLLLWRQFLMGRQRCCVQLGFHITNRRLYCYRLCAISPFIKGLEEEETIKAEISATHIKCAAPMYANGYM